YECCKKCQVVYTDDEGQWGVENKKWCFIEQSHCSSENTINTYPTCHHCNIYSTDNSGNWGIENNNWCVIQDSKCTSVNNN
ncbi:Non-catalytic module family DOC2, partial [Piromyces sp. E2]